MQHGSPFVREDLLVGWYLQQQPSTTRSTPARRACSIVAVETARYLRYLLHPRCSRSSILPSLPPWPPGGDLWLLVTANWRCNLLSSANCLGPPTPPENLGRAFTPFDYDCWTGLSPFPRLLPFSTTNLTIAVPIRSICSALRRFFSQPSTLHLQRPVTFANTSNGPVGEQESSPHLDLARPFPFLTTTILHRPPLLFLPQRKLSWSQTTTIIWTKIKGGQKAPLLN